MPNAQNLTNILNIKYTDYLLAHLLHAVSFQLVGFISTSVTQQIRRNNFIPQPGEVIDSMSQSYEELSQPWGNKMQGFGFAVLWI